MKTSAIAKGLRLRRELDDEENDHLEEKQNFAQVYSEGWQLLRRLSRRPATLRVYLWLAEAADRDNLVWISISDLQRATRVSRATIFRALRYLREEEALAWDSSPGCRNMYALNPKHIWRSNEWRRRRRNYYEKYQSSVMPIID